MNKRKIEQILLYSDIHPFDTNYINRYINNLENNWNELKMYFKKETIDLELIKEGISIDDYIDRKSFLSEVLNKIEEIEGKDNND